MPHSRYRRFQGRVWTIVQPDWMDEVPQFSSKIFDTLIAASILTSIGGVLISSIAEYEAIYHNQLRWVELITVVIFSSEYIVRFWSSAADDRYDDNFTSRLSYVISPTAIIDLIAIAPFYISFFAGPEFAQWLLAACMLRLLKLGWYFPSFRFLGGAIYKKRAFFAASGYLSVVIVLCASVFLWILEGEIQPEKFGSIPCSMWWAVVTLTTVGYGDAFPITVFGKIVAGILALSGIGIVCLPTAILAGEFAQIFKIDDGKECSACNRSNAEEFNYCSHCGTKLS